MIRQNLSNTHMVVSRYASEHKFQVLKTVSTSTERVVSSLELIREQIISEIKGVRELRRRMREQYPGLFANDQQ